MARTLVAASLPSQNLRLIWIASLDICRHAGLGAAQSEWHGVLVLLHWDERCVRIALATEFSISLGTCDDGPAVDAFILIFSVSTP